MPDAVGPPGTTPQKGKPGLSRRSRSKARLEAALWSELFAADVMLYRLHRKVLQAGERGRPFRPELEAEIQRINVRRAAILGKLRAIIREEMAATKPIT